MSNTFCRYLSNSYRFEYFPGDDPDTLRYKPCCHYLDGIKVDFNNLSDFYVEKDHLTTATEWLPECEFCEFSERTGQFLVQGDPELDSTSRRLRSFSEIPLRKDIPADAIQHLEISQDVTCNSACLSCGDWLSSMWRQENIRSGVKTKHDYNDLPTVDHNLGLMKKLDLRYLDRLSILGGEPFMMTLSHRLIKHIDEVKGLGDIDLFIQTNGSLLPQPELHELMFKFKSVRINFSLDGYGERFNYLRYPLKWDRVELVVNRILSTDYPGLTSAVNYVASPLSVLFFDEIYNWADRVFPEHVRLKLDSDRIVPIARPSPCHGVMDLGRISQRLRDAVIERYGSEHAITRLIDVRPNDEQGIPDMMRYLLRMDQIRKNSWVKTFPEIVKMF